MSETYLRQRHKCDIWTPTITTNAAGQRKSTFAVAQTSVKCDYIPKYAIFRSMPTVEEAETIKLIFANNIEIDYDDRITNVKNRFGTVIDSRTFEVVEILKQTGYQGKVHHIEVRVRRVME